MNKKQLDRWHTIVWFGLVISTLIAIFASWMAHQ